MPMSICMTILAIHVCHPKKTLLLYAQVSYKVLYKYKQTQKRTLMFLFKGGDVVIFACANLWK